MTGRQRRQLVWAVIGGVVLLGAVLALLLSHLGGTADGSSPSTSPAGQPAAPHPTKSGTSGDFVDPGVATRGWVPEPITQDHDAYVRAALEAAGTVDTRHATRMEWVSWLGTWFTPSPLYENPQDGLDQMAGYKTELDQSVVLSQQVWDELANGQGRVTAHVKGPIDYLTQAETTQKHMWTATANVVMTYTRTDNGQAVTYDDTVRVSVQVVCGGESVPTPESDQRVGDCKVVRFFDAAVG